MGAMYQSGADFTAFDKLFGGWVSPGDVLSSQQDATVLGRLVTLQSVINVDTAGGMATVCTRTLTCTRHAHMHMLTHTCLLYTSPSPRDS